MFEPETNCVEGDFRWLLSSPQYERLREKLIRVFARRGCTIPEDLADETIVRVMEKLERVSAEYEGDPIRYFYGVARNVFYEYTRRPVTVSFEENRLAAEEIGEPDVTDEETRERVERCLTCLSPEDRFVIGEYYRHDKAEKIANRRALARSLGLGLNALRIRAFRIRKRIYECVAQARAESEEKTASR